MSKRYRVIVKVYCSVCLSNVNNGERLNTKCQSCNFMKYNNVSDLLSFTSFLDGKHPNWVYFNCYEYIKGSNGRLLGSYQNKGERPMSKNEL